MSQLSISELFKKFTHLKVIVIGDVMVDNYIHGKVDRISPEAPVPVVNVWNQDSRLGGAGNVALNLKALGANPILISTIGNDKEGEDLKAILETNHISAVTLVKSEKRKTTTKIRVIGNGHQIVRIDHEENSDLDTFDSYLLQQHFEREIENADVVIFQDYNKGVLHKNNITTLLDIAKAKNTPTIVDPKKQNFLTYVGATLFKPNLKELKEGLNIETELDTNDKVLDAIDSLQNILQNTYTMVTMSERGVLINTKEKTSIIPAHLRNISDVSGAGDTVISIAALCLAAGCNIETIAGLSNLGGGLVCEEKGVVPINLSKLQEEAERVLIP